MQKMRNLSHLCNSYPFECSQSDIRVDIDESSFSANTKYALGLKELRRTDNAKSQCVWLCTHLFYFLAASAAGTR